MSETNIQLALVDEISVILSCPPTDIDADAPLSEMGIDSMSFVELLVFIENTFNLKLIESGLAKDDFKTVRSLSKRIAKEMEG